MKVLWIVLGVLACLCLLCAGGGYFIFNKGKAIFTEAAQAGDTSFQMIATTWDTKTFESLTAPEFGEKYVKRAVPTLMNKYRTTLGPIKGTVSGHITSLNVRNNNGVSRSYATWTADATFEKGPGTATMDLVNENGKWLIMSFDVNSSAIAR